VKQMTYLEIILWLEANVFDIGCNPDGSYMIKYSTDGVLDEYDEGIGCEYEKSLIECVLKANNAEITNG
jgi:hypothetical protein